MFRFLKRNITPEVVDMPVVTVQSNIAMARSIKQSRGYNH